MATNSENKKVGVFIGALAIVAILINVFFLTREDSPSSRPRSTSEPRSEQPKPAEVKKEVPTNQPAVETTNAVAHKRYVAAVPFRKPGIKIVAIAVGSDSGIASDEVTTALVEHFKSETSEISSSVFTGKFVSDGLINTAFRNPRSIVEQLELTNALDMLLLAREKVSYSTNTSLNNVLTANMEFEIMTVRVASPGQMQNWKLVANGAGFAQSDARKMAEERIIKQIMADTKMSLQSPSTQAAK